MLHDERQNLTIAKRTQENQSKNPATQGQKTTLPEDQYKQNIGQQCINKK